MQSLNAIKFLFINSWQILISFLQLTYKTNLNYVIHLLKCFSINFVSPLPSNSPNWYLLFTVDLYSRYLFSFASRDLSSDIMTDHLLSLFTMSTSSSQLHLDYGTQYKNKWAEKLLRRNSISKKHTSPYLQQVNGQWEHTYQTLLKVIKPFKLSQLGLKMLGWYFTVALSLLQVFTFYGYKP